MVAVGLLGEAAAPETGVQNGANPDDVTAWVLATVLARGQGAAGALMASQARWSGAAERTVDLAVARCAMVHALSAVG